MPIKLGAKVTDTVTGIVGSLTGKTQYVSGHKLGLVEWCDLFGGVNRMWFDMSRLSVVPPGGEPMSEADN